VDQGKQSKVSTTRSSLDSEDSGSLNLSIVLRSFSRMICWTFLDRESSMHLYPNDALVCGRFVPSLPLICISIQALHPNKNPAPRSTLTINFITIFLLWMTVNVITSNRLQNTRLFANGQGSSVIMLIMCDHRPVCRSFSDVPTRSFGRVQFGNQEESAHFHSEQI
jgi:hypothetical protein